MRKFLCISFLLLAACQPKIQSVPEDWIGKWIGPEGTYLEIKQGADGYITVATQSLDAWVVSQGKWRDDHIVFSRDGIDETVRKGTGEETGMKWLLDKENCLVIKTGEGYCR